MAVSSELFKFYRRVKHHKIQVKFDRRGGGGIHKNLTALWPVFDFDFGQTVNLWFLINNFCRDATISSKFYRRIEHHKIQAKFEIGGNLQTFD